MNVRTFIASPLAVATAGLFYLNTVIHSLSVIEENVFFPYL